MHGIWFDAGELDTLLEWIERGGLRRAREMQIEEQAHELRAERLKRMEPDPAENAKRSSPWDFFL